MSLYYGVDLPELPLFARPAPAQTHSATSRAAAESLGPKTLTRLHRQLLEYLATRPEGATDEEIATGLSLNPSTARPRRIELQRRGLVTEAGTRRTSSGRQAVVWQATAASR